MLRGGTGGGGLSPDQPNTFTAEQTFEANIVIGGSKLKTNNLLLREISPISLGIRNIADTSYKGLFADTILALNLSTLVGQLTAKMDGVSFKLYKDLDANQNDIKNEKQLQAKSKAGDPTASDIDDGFYQVWKNTTNGITKLWYNDGGVLKSVALA